MSRVNDWLWARDQMRSARNKEAGKPLMGNTRLVVSEVSPTDDWKSDEVVYAVQHWYTEVVRYFPNGIVAASLNGWNTVTTKLRIRRYSPFSIYTNRSRVSAGVGYAGSRWSGSEDTWFYWKRQDRQDRGFLCFQDGGRVPNLVHTKKKSKRPRA